MNTYMERRKIDVNDKIEKKNGLSYLSWAWAVDTLLQQDAGATWHYAEPQKFGESLMVFCTVTAFGKSMSAQLPVMDHRNKAILNPDAFAVNTAMQRALVKAIALHGIGLYIYAGEDLPAEPEFKADPRGDLTGVDNKARDRHVGEIGAILALDAEEYDIADQLRSYIAANLQGLNELYIAVADELATRKIISKGALKDYLKIKRAA